MRKSFADFTHMDAKSITTLLNMLRYAHTLLKNSTRPKGAHEFVLLVALELMLRAGSTALQIKNANLRLVKDDNEQE